jgi:glutathione S-transferase
MIHVDLVSCPSVAFMVHDLAARRVAGGLLGDRFTAVDILYMSLFERARELVGKRNWIEAYFARGLDRPAHQRALLKG